LEKKCFLFSRKCVLPANSSPRKNKKPKQKQTRGVSLCGLAIHIKKYLKAKEEL